MKFKRKILIVFLLMIVAIIFGMSDRCFAIASDISDRHLEKALYDNFASNEIEFTDTVTGTDYTYYLDKWGDFWLDTYNNRFKISNGDTSITVKYDLYTMATEGFDEDGDPKSDADDQVGIKISANKPWEEIDDYEYIIKQISIRLYLCSSIAIGQDVSLALTCYEQNKDEYGDYDDVFWLYENDIEQEYTGCINLEELKYLKDSDVDKSISNYEITYGIKNIEEKISIRSCDIYGPYEEKYTGYTIKPTIHIYYCKENNKEIELIQGKDYIVKYSDNKKAGTATAIIESIGNTYTGNVMEKFDIVKKDIADSNISIDFADESYWDGYRIYTGKSMKPSMSVSYSDGTDMKLGTDFTISYSNNTNPGEAKVTIKGKGNFTGTVTKTFVILPKKVEGLKVSKQTTSSVTIEWKKNGEKITGYEVYSYNYKYEYWEYIGDTTKTTYTIKNLKAGTTYKFKVCAHKDYDAGPYSSSLKTTTKTKTPSISKLTTKSKKVTLKWNKISGATGYRIYMATSKNGTYTKIKEITKGSTVTYTKSSLKKNKKYYFKIRAYKTINGKNIYSSYSSVKSITVK